MSLNPGKCWLLRFIKSPFLTEHSPKLLEVWAKCGQNVDKRKQARLHLIRKWWSDLLFLVRTEGFELPAY
ncbi:hypothetical protein FB472_1160 [Rhodoglobus vestalii]|uniref:Uncharacterized protein n=1 Tax=Rhodoglobus vestalii TaxID=193384 RepID=A0A8H2K6A7_9MICO|nr:hypothetical protein FB472_1160 [Rhodoglobus vestalii]